MNVNGKQIAEDILQDLRFRIKTGSEKVKLDVFVVGNEYSTEIGRAHV